MKTIEELRAWLATKGATITELSDEHRAANNSTASHEVRRGKFVGRYNFPPEGHVFFTKVCELVVEDIEQAIAAAREAL